MPTMSVNRPNPYDSGYHTVGQLVHDSFIVVLGSLQGPVAGSYFINIDKELAGDTKTSIGLSSALVSALKLDPNRSYVFFCGTEGYPLTGGACIIGGERGVMAYDAATNTITRLDKSHRLAHTEISVPGTASVEDPTGRGCDSSSA